MTILKYNLPKRFIELIITFSLIICGLPIILLICFLIKLNSRGPIFYKQKRIGKNLRFFNCIKFRTMSQEAELILENLLDKNQKIKEEFEKNQKIKNDPRITDVGKVLRLLSLDELPQLINVIKGEMSLVGPRPIIESEKKRYGEHLKEVFSVKPGITGLWQVSGRNNLSYKKRVFLDNAYIDNINFFSDLKILFKTIWVLLFPLDRGAY